MIIICKPEATDAQIAHIEEAIHNGPEHALSDGEPAMLPDKFEALVKQMRAVASAIGKEI
jgi:3-deoxy-D-arabino-heptulosonate 7-phosphate (DAHP) synthase